MTTVLGIDPSLTGTGVALIEEQSDIRAVTVSTCTSGRTTLQGLDGRVQRQARICAEILAFLAGRDVDLAVIEAPAYDSRTGQQHDRSGLWWRIIDRFYELDVPVAEVTTGGLKKYATGKGNAKKDEVLVAVVRRYPAVEVDNNNEADALVLAAMGARHIGRPIEESLPQLNLQALAKVGWPA